MHGFSPGPHAPRLSGSLGPACLFIAHDSDLLSLDARAPAPLTSLLRHVPLRAGPGAAPRTKASSCIPPSPRPLHGPAPGPRSGPRPHQPCSARAHSSNRLAISAATTMALITTPIDAVQWHTQPLTSQTVNAELWTPGHSATLSTPARRQVPFKCPPAPQGPQQAENFQS